MLLIIENPADRIPVRTNGYEIGLGEWSRGEASEGKRNKLPGGGLSAGKKETKPCMRAANRRGPLSSHKTTETTAGLNAAPTSLNVGFVSRKRIGRAADFVNAGRIAKKGRMEKGE